MEIHSRLNREIDYSPWVFGPLLIGLLKQIVSSSLALDHHLVERTSIAAQTTVTRRIINPSFNFLILSLGVTGSPSSALNQTTMTLEDGEVGRRYFDTCPLATVAGRVGASSPLPLPLVHLKGRPLDLILTNGSSTNLDFVEILFRGIRF